MPEIKNQFTGGKMNKDLDERLVPKGEYRDAMNIQVSTSEESDVGSVQNILGNVAGCTYTALDPNPIQPGSYTVGSISDEKNDSLYWLVSGPDDLSLDLDQNGNLIPGSSISFKDMIMRTNSDLQSNCEPVFVDKWKFCTAVNPAIYGSNLTNGITLDNSNLYSSITAGMNVTGYTGGTSVFSNVTVTGVGSASSIPVYYNVAQQPLLPSTSATTNFSIRTFEDPFTPFFGAASAALIEITYGPSSVLGQNNEQPPAAGNIQLVFPTSSGNPAPPQEFFEVGAEIQEITAPSSPSGSKVIIGDGINPLVVVSCTFAQITSTYNTVGAGGMAIVAGAKVDVYLVEIDLNGNTLPTWSTGNQRLENAATGGILDTRPAFPDVPPLPSQYRSYRPVRCKATTTFTGVTPTNVIEVNTSTSSQWLNEIYEAALDPNAKIKINNNIGAGSLWPQNSCIKLSSINMPVNNVYDSSFEIVNCDNDSIIHEANSFQSTRIGDLLTFEVVSATNLQQIFLNRSVNLQGVDSFCFEKGKILKFDSNRLITGLDIIDDMLFWTDNFTEPKKINIPRSKEGTEYNGDRHTAVVNNAAGLNLSNYNPIREEHITVIRKSPKNALNLDLISSRDPFLNYSGVVNTIVDGGLPSNNSIIHSSNPTVEFDFLNLAIDDVIKLEIKEDLSNNTSFLVNWQVGNFVLLKEFENGLSAPVPLDNFTIRCRINDWVGNNFDSYNGPVQVELKVVNIVGTPPQPDQADPNDVLSFTIDLEDTEEVIFEDKLPRFSYRYKYEDGEYSTYAPWSQVAFLPSFLSYDSTGGFNKGMTNNITSIKLTGFKTLLPGVYSGQDVTEIDIVYKEDSSPNVYLVQTLSPIDLPQFGSNIIPWWSDEYEITSETIKSLLPSNQLLRPWDNVPKKALAQAITGSRIVYGNYEQNYDLTVADKKYKPSFKNYLSNWPLGADGSAQKSIKSLRNYKLGVVFTDEYGRETPVIISESGGFKVEKINSKTANRLSVGLQGNAPENMAFFKFYIKETSTEYYNLPMDRWYNAEDGNIWLAFPSLDRNKIDLETSLYFKKGSNDNVIENTTRYKVLAIENEAPDFIKTRRIRIGNATHNTSQIVSGSINAVLFGTTTHPLENAPKVNSVSFDLNYVEGKFASSSMSHLEEVKEELYIQFVSSTNFSSQYKVSEVTSDRDEQAALATPLPPSKYFVTLDTNLKDDISFIFDDPTNPSIIQDEVKIVFTKAVLENAAKFDGRFFAKIENDGKIQTQITDDSIGINYIEKASKMVYVLDDDETLKVRSSNTLIDSNSVNYITKDYSNAAIFNTTATNYDVSGAYSANPSGNNWNYALARQSYFGKLSHPTADISLATGGFRPDDYGGIAEAGVWFIDRSTKKYTQYTSGPDDNDLNWDLSRNMNAFTPGCNIIGSLGCGAVPHTPTNSLFQGLGQGIKNYNSTNSGYINLSFGGIDQRVLGKGLNRYIKLQYVAGSGTARTYGLSMFGESTFENFFSIGQDVGTYGDSDTNEFVSRFNAGFKFKWENDPTETVYTIEGETRRTHQIRFGRWDHGGVPESATPLGKGLIKKPSSYHKAWGFGVSPQLDDGSVGWDPANGDGGGVGTYMHNGLALGTGTKSFSTTNLFLAFDLLTATTAGATTFTFDLNDDISRIQKGMLVVNQDNPSAINPGTVVTNVDTTTNTVTFACFVSGVTGAVSACAAGDDIEFAFAINLVEEYIYGGPNNPSDVTENYIIVDNITTACSNGNTSNPTYSLHKGMMLDLYNIDLDTNSSGTAPGVTGTRENNVIIKELTYIDADDNWRIDLTGYHTPLHYDYSTNTATATEFSTNFIVGTRLQFRQVAMNGASNFTEVNTSNSSSGGGNNVSTSGNLSGGIGAVGYKMIMVEPIDEYGDGGNLPPDPFVWETEPKEAAELDVYYEISENNPIELNNDTINSAIPVNSLVTSDSGEGLLGDVYTVGYNSIQGNRILLSNPVWIGPGPSPAPVVQPLTIGSKLKITKPNGIVFEATIKLIPGPGLQPPGTPASTARLLVLDENFYNNTFFLNWHNCYSFGNGVESNRIKDTFNSPFMTNGVKVSTILDQEYVKEHRKHGLIYSGIYNSNSGVNNLNQFIQAEKITKDINPIYGSIQKLHSGWGQSGDLVALCEDRVLKILANKDALFNADGDTNVTATNRVLGTATPYSGEFGISKNPESFASEAYRAYFTDKVRGTVMRLSIDGLTPISNHGMKDWFRDNLKLNNKLIGSYDDKKDQYNITLPTTNDSPIASKTVTFKEDVRGWVSFKSFVPENAISCANEYYTFKDGNLWKHHVEVFDSNNLEINRNTFYKTPLSSNNFTSSSLKVILGDSSGIIKTFHTLNYEGSQSKIDEFRQYDTFLPGTTIVRDTYNFTDNDHIGYYNLNDIPGWYVESVKTNLEEGGLNEFIKKEGKWFNYIKGKVGSTTNQNPVINIQGGFNNTNFSFQGVARVAQVVNFNTLGCTDPLAFNYDPGAVDDDGSCVPFVYGCIDVNASNYNNLANTDTVPTACIYEGCTDPLAFNYDANANFDDGSCIPVVLGCIDNTQYNYDPNANTDDGSCIPFIYGCTDNGPNPNGAGVINDINSDKLPAINYNPLANTDDGSCVHEKLGCKDPLACNYDPAATIDDGSCTKGGCTTDYACNYDPLATCDNGSCNYCKDVSSNVLNFDNGSCNTGCIYCEDPIDITPTVGTGSTAGTALLTWVPLPTPSTGVPTPAPASEGYVVYLYEDPLNIGTPQGSPIQTITLPTGQTSHTFYGLIPGSSYVFKIKSHCASSPSNIYSNGSIAAFLIPIPPVLGCTASGATNYDPLATQDDGSCLYEVFGCPDSTACNYYGSVPSNTTIIDTTPTTSCIYGNADKAADIANGYLNLSTLIVNCYDQEVFDTTTCTWGVTGTPPIHPYFNNAAAVGQTISAGNWGGNQPTNVAGSYVITNCDITSGSNFGILFDSSFGSCKWTFTPSTTNGCTDDGASSAPAGITWPRPMGYSGPAMNYDPTATCDDGSCAYIGTTTVSAPFRSVAVTSNIVTYGGTSFFIYKTGYIFNFSYAPQNIGDPIPQTFQFRYRYTLNDHNSPFQPGMVNHLPPFPSIHNHWSAVSIPGVGAQSGYYRGGNFPADPTKFVAFGCTSNCVSYASTTPIPNASGGATGGSGQLSVWSPQDPQNTAYMTVEFRAVYTDPVTGIITRGPWVANSLQV